MFVQTFLLNSLLITSVLAGFPPGPPSILGPVTEASSFIQVTNLVSDVQKVTVYVVPGFRVVAEGVPQNIRGATGVVPVIAPLPVGAELRVDQSSPSGTSPSSAVSEIRVGSFKQPGPPRITSLLHTCINALQIADVLVGAEIEVSVWNRGVIGKGKALDTSDIWIKLDPTFVLLPGHQIKVTQYIIFNGFGKSGSTTSDPIQLFDFFMGIGSAKLDVGPLHACEQSIDVKGGIPGASYALSNKGAKYQFYSPAFRFQLHLGKYLVEDLVSFTQSPLPTRCDKNPTPPQKFTVLPATNPPMPVLEQSVCDDSRSLKFSGLVYGGSLIIISTNSAGTKWGYEYGPGRLDKSLSTDVKIGRGWTTTFYQTDACGNKSPMGTVRPITNPPVQDLEFLTKLYECSSVVAFFGNPSSRTSLWWDDDSLQPIRLSTSAIAQEVPGGSLIHTPILWERLREGQKIFLRQDGCGAPQESKEHRYVLGLPTKLSAPSWGQQQISEIDTKVLVEGVLPGALVKVFVEGSPYGEAEASGIRVTVHLVGPQLPGGRPLIPGQKLTAIQVFNCEGDLPFPSPPGPVLVVQRAVVDELR